MKHSEVLINTQTKLSCVVTFLTEELEQVNWEKPDSGVIVHGTDGYEIDEGTYNRVTNTKTTVLTVPADKNNVDSVYTCVIKNVEDYVTHRYPVASDVYSKLQTSINAKKVHNWL